MKLKTLHSVTQNGAQLHIMLAGDRENVQRDAFFLSNNGIAELPEEYDETKDDYVILKSNLYRLAKFARADKMTKMIQRKGLRATINAIKSGMMEKIIKTSAHGILKSLRAMCEPYNLDGLPEYHNPIAFNMIRD